MNREIKFRGKDLDGNTWVYGDYVSPQANGAPPMIYDTYTGYPVEVKPETVGQYTGLKDKNGVEIYEGDILRDGDQMTIIEFDNIGSWDSDGAFYSWGYQTNLQKPNECGIIGNIHENSELLAAKAREDI